MKIAVISETPVESERYAFSGCCHKSDRCGWLREHAEPVEIRWTDDGKAETTIRANASPGQGRANRQG
jgi:hypothetical protein